MKFLIDGYWKDDKSEFNNYIVSSYDDYYEEDEDDIFYYGLNENEIKKAIQLVEDTSLEFVITSYTKF